MRIRFWHVKDFSQMNLFFKIFSVKQMEMMNTFFLQLETVLSVLGAFYLHLLPSTVSSSMTINPVFELILDTLHQSFLNPRSNSWNAWKKLSFFENWQNWKVQLFWVSHFDFFFFQKEYYFAFYPWKSIKGSLLLPWFPPQTNSCIQYAIQCKIELVYKRKLQKVYIKLILGCLLIPTR